MGLLLASVLGALAISLGTADMLAYLELAVVTIFLVSGPVIVYIFYKRHQREETTAGSEPAPSSSG